MKYERLSPSFCGQMMEISSCMMEIAVTVPTFPKKIVCFRTARPAGGPWRREVHRLPYPRLAGEKAADYIALPVPWISL